MVRSRRNPKWGWFAAGLQVVNFLMVVAILKVGSHWFPPLQTWMAIACLVMTPLGLVVSLRLWGQEGAALARGRQGFCANCGYDRRSMARERACPECGELARSGQGSPTGRPVCARCGRDMRGREDGRTCPDCGAMYGIEYVDAPGGSLAATPDAGGARSR